ncbi:hypothetical protein JHW43_002088, partial [Diplocarpon mali]
SPTSPQLAQLRKSQPVLGKHSYRLGLHRLSPQPRRPRQMAASTDLPPEAIAFATRMYEAARAGQTAVFEQALPAGLPANMTNDKGDSLVNPSSCASILNYTFPTRLNMGYHRRLIIRHRIQLMLASYHGHAPLVTVLLRHGADPNRVNDRGQTPLAGAVFKGEAEVVEALLAGGADPDHGSPSAMQAVALFRQEERWKGRFEGAAGRGLAGKEKGKEGDEEGKGRERDEEGKGRERDEEGKRKREMAIDKDAQSALNLSATGAGELR